MSCLKILPNLSILLFLLASGFLKYSTLNYKGIIIVNEYTNGWLSGSQLNFMYKTRTKIKTNLEDLPSPLVEPNMCITFYLYAPSENSVYLSHFQTSNYLAPRQ